MRLKVLFELRIARFVDHLRQRLHDLFLRVVDVAQRVDEQVVHCFDVFREEAHIGFSIFVLCLWVWSARQRMSRAHHASVQRAKRVAVPESVVIALFRSVDDRNSQLRARTKVPRILMSSGAVLQ